MVAAALLDSCAPEVPQKVAFNEAAFAGYGGSGSGQVMGRAAAVTGDSAEKPATFTKVTLMPVNAYTTEIVQRSYVQQENLQQPDPRFQKYVRQVESDGAGKFVFRNVYWDHWIYAKVWVKSGQTVTVGAWEQKRGG